MCVTDRHDMTLGVKVALNPNTTNQPTLPKNAHHDHPCSLNVVCTYCSLKVAIAANLNDVCLQNTSKTHSYHLKYGIIMTLWIGNGAVFLKVPLSGN